MEVKRYFGSNMNEVMAKIREECGADAVILSTRTVRAKGIQGLFAKPLTEVMVAYEGQGGLAPQAAKQGASQGAARPSLFKPKEESAHKPGILPKKEKEEKKGPSVTRPKFETLQSDDLVPGLMPKQRMPAEMPQTQAAKAMPDVVGLDAKRGAAKPLPFAEELAAARNPAVEVIRSGAASTPPRPQVKPPEIKIQPAPVAAPAPAPAAPPRDDLADKVDALTRMILELSKKVEQTEGDGRAFAAVSAQPSQEPQAAEKAADAPSKPADAPVVRRKAAQTSIDLGELEGSPEAVRLDDQEVEAELAARLLSEAQKSRAEDETLAKALYRTVVEFLGDAEPIVPASGKKQTVVLLLGPTGVGKTTSLIKLAAQFVVHEDMRVGLINADTYRVGAKEQIATYAEILEIPLSVVYSVDGLVGAMRALADRDLLFIDTAGKKPSDERHKLEVQQIIDTCAPDEIFLVVSASTGNRAIREIIRNYAFLPRFKIIVTKLDEVSSVGAVLNAGFYSGMPVSYLAGGQRVPEDLAEADAQQIAGALLGRSGTW